MKFACLAKNKKGAALTYAVMVLLLLSTVVVAITALASSSYTSAVIAASDDQSYFYAKSIGLALRKEFNEVYSISNITRTLDAQIAEGDKSPEVSGTYTISTPYGEVDGTVHITYGKDSTYTDSDPVWNKYVLEMRVACLYNNKLSIVTSLFSCESDLDSVNEVEDLLTYYDVVLTNTDDLNFSFADSTTVSSGTGANIYVYAGEDDTVENPPFNLYVNMTGRLTTTGKTTIVGKGATSNEMRAIYGQVTSYGDIALTYVGVWGALHSKGGVTLNGDSFVSDSIYSEGKVKLTGGSAAKHNNGFYNVLGFGEKTIAGYPMYYNGGVSSYNVTNIFAKDDVSIGARSVVMGDIVSNGNVTINGTGAKSVTSSNNYDLGNTFIQGNIYALGDVTISGGAIVLGNIITKGNVTIKSGAKVGGVLNAAGHILANGNITVQNAVVMGAAQCNGTLRVETTDATYANDYLMAQGFGYQGVYGGVGYNIIYGDANIVNKCNKLRLADSPYKVYLGRDTYVKSAYTTYNSVKVTPILSVYVPGTLYLQGSSASFSKNANGERDWAYSSSVGMVYSQVFMLWQDVDLIANASGNTNDKYVDFHGATIGVLRVGKSTSTVKDCYIENAWITAFLYGRCVYLKDTLIGTEGLENCCLYAQRSLDTCGSAGTISSGIELTNDHGGGYTKFIGGGNSKICVGTVENVSVGANFGACTYVNSTQELCIGSESVTGLTFNLRDKCNFRGKAVAYANTIIEGGAVLSGNELTAGTMSAPSANLTIHGTLTVKKSTNNLRGGSTINVEGNTIISGGVYNLYHFGGNFVMNSSVKGSDYNGRVYGTFWSNSNGTLEMNGTFGRIECTGINSILKVTSNLTINGDCILKGEYLNPDRKNVNINGNMYVGKVSTPNYDFVVSKVTGDATIADGSTFTMRYTKDGGINGELCSRKATIYLGSSNVNNDYVYVDSVTCENLIIQLKGRVLTKALVLKDLTLPENGGQLGVSGRCDVEVGNTLYVKGGKIAGDRSAVYIKTLKYEQTGGIAMNTYAYANDKATSTPFHFGGGTYFGEVECTNQGGLFDGGNFEGQVWSKKSVYIYTNFNAIRDGVNVTDGSLFIGKDGSNGVYSVGGDNAPMYAKNSVVWTGKAKTWTTSNEQKATSIGSSGDVVIGSSSNRIIGTFGSISGNRVTVYTNNIGSGVKSASDALINVSGHCGLSNAETTDCGAKVGGNLTIAGIGSSTIFKGIYDVGYGQVTIAGPLKFDARIGCSTISGLNQVATETVSSVTGSKLSLSVSGYSSFELPMSLLKNTEGTTGSITVLGGDLVIPSGKVAQGEIYVDGIYYYGGSNTELRALNGLYCLNTTVNLTPDSGGALDLPNVTTITLTRGVTGITADKVTSIILNGDLDGSIKLKKVTTFSLSAGQTVGGSVEISDSGTITNNGTIKGSVCCGKYSGSGKIGGDLLIKGTSESTINGVVSGNIWSAGKITLNQSRTNTFGNSGSYIYSRKSIVINNAKFDSDMDYIMSTGGDLYLGNCLNIPNLKNSYGYIKLINNSDYATTVKSVWSSGTYVYFGTGTSSNYQTISGKVQWLGKYTQDYAIKVNNSNTKFLSHCEFVGEGNIYLNGNFDNNNLYVDVSNIGSVNFAGGRFSRIYVNSSSYLRVTSVTLNAPISNKLDLLGNSSHLTSVTVNGTVGSGGIRAKGIGTLTINKAVSGNVIATACNDVIVKGAISGMLRIHDSNAHVYANVSSNVTSTSSVVKSLVLGTQSAPITIGGDIIAHANVLDNSKNSGNITVQGSYYGDIGKTYSSSKSLNVTCKSGFCWLFGKSANDTMNGVVNVKGWLIINSNKNGSSTLTFNAAVKANALTVNTQNYSNVGGNSAIASSFGRNSTSIDGNWGAIPSSGLKTSTSKQLVIFNKPVYVTENGDFKGVCQAANCKFSTLYTQGQTCLEYCQAYSQNYSSDTNHCSYETKTVDGVTCTSVSAKSDGSLFIHTLNNATGDNWITNTDTYSNVSSYFGVNFIGGSSEFKGCTLDGQGDGGIAGSTSTKLFYFGESLFLYDTAHITDSKSIDSNIPAGRTIVWVKTGVVIMMPNTYIGVKRFTRSPTDKSSLNRDTQSVRPGLFVSDTNSGVVNILGGNYTRGTCHIYGCVTVDIASYRDIFIYSGGVVVEKDKTSSSNKYKAGYYVSSGYVQTQNGAGWYTGTSSKDGWFALFDASSGGRYYYIKNDGSQVTDSSTYLPSGANYASHFKSKTGKGSSQAQNIYCYTPINLIPSVLKNNAPTGIGSTSVTTSQGISSPADATDLGNISPKSITAPNMPNVEVENGIANGTIAPLNITNNRNAVTGIAEMLPAIKLSAVTVSSSLTARFMPLFAWNVSTYSAAGISEGLQNVNAIPSVRWTTEVQEHFNIDNQAYWGVRAMPYVWTLPDDDIKDVNGTTVKKSDLEFNKKLTWSQIAYKTSKVNGPLQLNTKYFDSNGKYITKDAYSGSSLASYCAGNLNKDRNGKDMIVFTSHWNSDSVFSRDGYTAATGLLFFESGILDSAAVDYGNSNWAKLDEALSQNGKSGKIVYNRTAKAYRFGAMHDSPDGSDNDLPDSANSQLYDVSWVFFACADPTNPYGSAAKDLHIILPAGLATVFRPDSDTHVSVVGNGRVFLYVQSGSTLYFYGDKNFEGNSWAVGGLTKTNSQGKTLSTPIPQLYIIGVGTNIDIVIKNIQLYAYIYMPFGTNNNLYGSDGNLWYRNIANQSKITSFDSNYYSATSNLRSKLSVSTIRTTKVSSTLMSNTLTLWYAGQNNTKYIYGNIVADNFLFKMDSAVNVHFVSSKAPPDLNDTTIWKGTQKHTYSLSQFINIDITPGISNEFYKWNYAGIRVD